MFIKLLFHHLPKYSCNVNSRNSYTNPANVNILECDDTASKYWCCVIQRKLFMMETALHED